MAHADRHGDRRQRGDAVEDAALAENSAAWKLLKETLAYEGVAAAASGQTSKPKR